MQLTPGWVQTSEYHMHMCALKHRAWLGIRKPGEVQYVRSQGSEIS